MSALCLAACSAAAPPSLDDLRIEAEKLAEADKRAAIAAFQELRRLSPTDAALLWRLAQLYADTGELDLAHAYLEDALAAGVSPSSVLPLMAEVLLAKRAYKELFALDAQRGTGSAARAVVSARKALGHLELRNMEAAERALEEALAEDPQSGEVAVAMATLEVAKGRAERAEQILREAASARPRSADVLGMLADLTRRDGRLEEAEALYGRALETSPFKVHFHFTRAEVRLDLGMTSAAGEDVAAVVDLAPDTFAALHAQGRLALIQGDPAAALDFLESALRLRPWHLPSLHYAGLAAFAVGRKHHAEDWLSRVLKEMPGNASARLILAAIRFDQRRYDEAEELLRPATAAELGTGYPERLMAAILIAQGKAAEAIPLLSRLVSVAPDDPRSKLDLAVALVLSGAKERGAALLDSLAAQNPDYRPAYEYLVALYIRERRLDEALQWADRYARQYPHDSAPMLAQGDVLVWLDRVDEARALYERVLASDAAHPQANMRLASLAVRDGDRKAAVHHVDRVLVEHPEHLKALVGRARLALASGHTDAALKSLRRAVAAHPEAVEPRLLMARVQLRSRHPRAALDALQADAVEAFRGEPAYLELLIESLLAADMPQQAADAARELLLLRPDSLDAHGIYARVLTVLDDKIALEETLERMLAIAPGDQSTRLELVRLHIATERFDTAERLLSPLLTDGSRPWLADLLYGLILTATDRAEEALAPLGQAHDRRASQRTLLALANAEAQAGRVDDAIERQRAWLGEHPADVEVKVNLAGHLVQAERVSAALVQYEEALTLNPHHVVALNNLAWYSLEAAPQRAIELAERALQTHPESREAAHTLAAAQMEAEQWRDAELTLDRALARYPTDSGLLWLSALVLQRKGEAEYASERLARLLQGDLPADERDRAAALLAEIEDELRAERAGISR